MKLKDKLIESFGVYSAAEKIASLICSLVWPPIPGIVSKRSNITPLHLVFDNRGIIEVLKDAVRDSAILCPDLKNIADQLNCYLSDFESECEILNTHAEDGNIFANKIVSLIDEYVFEGVIGMSSMYPFANDSSYSYNCEFTDTHGSIESMPLGAYNVPGYFYCIHNPFARFMDELTREFFDYEDEDEESVGAFAEFVKMLKASNCDPSNRIYRRIDAVLPVLYAIYNINLLSAKYYDPDRSDYFGIIEECLKRGHRKHEVYDKYLEKCRFSKTKNFEAFSSLCLLIEYKSLLGKYRDPELDPIIENLDIVIDAFSKYQSCYDMHESAKRNSFDFANDYNSIFCNNMKILMLDLGLDPSIGYSLSELDIDKSIAVNALESDLGRLPIVGTIINTYSHSLYEVEHGDMLEAIKAIIS